MTAHKHLKQLVRTRMRKTGESYATARRHIVQQAPVEPSTAAAGPHGPGSVPGATALRILLNHAGLRDPRNGAPLSEAMVFGLAGGIGAGVFSFHYEKQGWSSFFIAGRHLWQDELAYLQGATARLGLEPIVTESAGAKTAEKQLRDMIEAHGPCIAWVDMVGLPHRGKSETWAGTGYHLITVYGVDDVEATIGDLTDEPIGIPLDRLAVARGRIKKDKNRLLALPTITAAPDLRAAALDGLRACHGALVEGRMANFTLAAFETLARRLHGAAKDPERWEIVFPRGGKLWTGLTSLHNYIEHYGTGGGLCRPIFAEFLTEAATAFDLPELGPLSERYDALGRDWSSLAEAALPDRVPLFRRAKEAMARRAEMIAAGATDEVRAAWRELGELAVEAGEEFPIPEAEVDELRRELRARVWALYEGEMAAREEMGRVLAGLYGPA